MEKRQKRTIIFCAALLVLLGLVQAYFAFFTEQGMFTLLKNEPAFTLMAAAAGISSSGERRRARFGR